MAQDQLFEEICKPEIMRIGWYLAQADSKDDFVTDPVGNADFASSLGERLKHVVEQVQNYRYRPHHLLEIDIPKSGLSVRPGNVLPIEEASLLHAIVYLLAPLLDKCLGKNVYSFRLHPNWKARIKKRGTLFREDSGLDFPFLKRKTIKSFDPFASWYELWPEFERQAVKAVTEEGYTHVTKTDIAAYFENIDLGLLENQIRSLLKREEDKILQVLFRVLDGWVRVTSTGTPIGRGIPQGNEIGSFLGNIYLVPLDRVLTAFCKTREATWFRYVDDVKVFTKNDQDAREAVFVINRCLRSLHLNLQGSKTEVLFGSRLVYELDQADADAVEAAITATVPRGTDKLPSPSITKALKGVASIRSTFTRNLPASVTKLDSKKNRLFRRLLTLFGQCKRPQMRVAALAAIRHLPDMRILKRSLGYLTQLPYNSHTRAVEDLMAIIQERVLPFPYQVSVVLETIGNLHPTDVNDVASQIRKVALNRRADWIVCQRGLEAMAVYPYPDTYCFAIASRYVENEHPMVRRAAFLLLMRSPNDKILVNLNRLIYHADPGVSRLALYFLRHLRDQVFAGQELTRLQNGSKTDSSFQRSLSKLYALAVSSDKLVAQRLRNFVLNHPTTKSNKLIWHRTTLLRLTAWTDEIENGDRDR